MSRCLRRLWTEEVGFIVSAELVLIATIVVISLVVGLTEVRDAVTSELVDVSNAFGSMNQSFHFHGGHGFAGSSFHDEPDNSHEVAFVHPHGEGQQGR